MRQLFKYIITIGFLNSLQYLEDDNVHDCVVHILIDMSNGVIKREMDTYYSSLLKHFTSDEIEAALFILSNFYKKVN